MENKAYWVSELTPAARAELFEKVYNSLKTKGYDMESEEMVAYMADIENEKVGNLEEHLTEYQDEEDEVHGWWE